VANVGPGDIARVCANLRIPNHHKSTVPNNRWTLSPASSILAPTKSQLPILPEHENTSTQQTLRELRRTFSKQLHSSFTSAAKAERRKQVMQHEGFSTQR